jgi:hypothetical protein
VDVKGNAEILDKSCFAEAIRRMGQFETNRIKMEKRKNELENKQKGRDQERNRIPQCLRDCLKEYEKERTATSGASLWSLKSNTGSCQLECADSARLYMRGMIACPKIQPHRKMI